MTKVVNLLDSVTLPTAENDVKSPDESFNPESMSGAMSIDLEGQCPKCLRAMGMATSLGETVYYCEPCRVTNPIPV